MTISLALHQTHVVIAAPCETKQVTKSQHQTRNSANAPTKQVKFLPYVTSYRDTAIEHNATEQWYSADDYARFRAEIVSDSKKFKSLNPKSVRVMKLIMKACRKASEHSEDDSDDALSRVLQPRLEDFLQQVLQDAPYIVGLHKFCVDGLVEDKLVRRSRLTEVVLATQSAPWSLAGTGMIPEGECEQISRPSRLFAKVMGRLAAKAA